jgi:serine/threonine protein kinase
MATDLRTNKKCALKLECKRGIKNPRLEDEAYMYERLKGVRDVPRLLWYGTVDRKLVDIDPEFIEDNPTPRILVTDLMGPSLDRLFDKCGKSFTLKTVIVVAHQMLHVIEAIHKRGIIHRDIKPANIVVGRGNDDHNLYLVDFGLARLYIENGKHIPFSDGHRLTGTALYASMDTHRGIEQSRKTDLECLGFVLLYFLYGRLPWTNIPYNRKDKDQQQKRHRQIYQYKKKYIYSILEELPSQFRDYFEYCWNLDFEEKPNYRKLRKMFGDLFRAEGYKYDMEWDWTY